MTGIDFDGTHYIFVQESVDDVARAMMDALRSIDTMVRLTGAKGEKVWVQAHNVKCVQEVLPGAPTE